MKWSPEKIFQGISKGQYLYYSFWRLRTLLSPLSLNGGVFTRYGIKSPLVVLYQYQETSLSSLIGLERYSEVGSITDKIFTLYYDHRGFIHKLTPDRFENSGSFAAFGNSKGIFGQVSDVMH